MQNTQVKDVMAKDIVMISPDDTLQQAACKMQEADCGVLPVGTKDNIAGVITDRDIVIRAVCKGLDPASEKCATT